jgi:hypothetical protein
MKLLRNMPVSWEQLPTNFALSALRLPDATRVQHLATLYGFEPGAKSYTSAIASLSFAADPPNFDEFKRPPASSWWPLRWLFKPTDGFLIGRERFVLPDKIDDWPVGALADAVVELGDVDKFTIDKGLGLLPVLAVASKYPRSYDSSKTLIYRQLVGSMAFGDFVFSTLFFCVKLRGFLG